MISYDFTKQAEKAFLKLPQNIQNRIIKKLESYLISPDPLFYAKRLTGSSSYRFSIGDYRVIFDREETKILIIKIGHRREVYR